MLQNDINEYVRNTVIRNAFDNADNEKWNAVGYSVAADKERERLDLEVKRKREYEESAQRKRHEELYGTPR